MTQLRHITLVACMSAFKIYAGEINEDLITAAKKGDVASVKALLARGADVNAKSQYGATSLSFAADKGHLEVVKALLDNGADLNVKDKFYQETPIGWAAYRGHSSIVKALLDKGAEGRESALIAGVEMGHLEVVRIVLSEGKISSEVLTSAYESAKRGKHPEIIALLENAGATSAPKADFQVDPETLRTYAGIYRNQDGVDIKLELVDGTLKGGFLGEDPLTVGFIDKVTFQPVELPGMTLTFNLESGNVTGLTLKDGTSSQIFKRVEEK